MLESIAATNKYSGLHKQQLVCEDLYFRLAVFVIEIPPGESEKRIYTCL